MFPAASQPVTQRKATMSPPVIIQEWSEIAIAETGENTGCNCTIRILMEEWPCFYTSSNVLWKELGVIVDGARQHMPAALAQRVLI